MIETQPILRECDSQRLLIAANALLLLAVNWVFAAKPSLFGITAWWVHFSLLAGLFAQVSVVVIWAVVSRRSFLVRSLAMLVLVPTLAAIDSNVVSPIQLCGWWICDQYDDPSRHMTWVVRLGTMASLIFVGMSALRAIGVRLTNRRLISGEAPPNYQFELKHAFVWVTCIAVLLAAWNWLVRHGWSAAGLLERLEYGPHRPPAEFAGLAILLSLVLLSKLPLYYSVPAMLNVPIILSYVDAHYLKAWILDDIGNGRPWSVYLAAYISFSAIVAINLLWCRHRGYRLEWRTRADAIGAPE